MDIDRVRYFIAVCETQSLRRASEMVYVTPPALSKAIKTLETELGFKLTVPAGRAIRITDQGLELARRMKPILERIQAVEAAVKNRAAVKEPLRVGTFEVFSTHFLAPLLEELAGEAIDLLELIPGQLEKAIERREVDIGITYLPVPSGELDHRKIAEIEMGVYARRGAFDRLPFSELPFVVPILPVEGAPTKARGLDGWPDDKIRRNVKFRVALMESAMELCRQGLAAAYLPAFVVELHNKKHATEFQLQKIRPPRPIGARKQPVYLVKRKADLDVGPARKITDVLRRICR